MAQDIVINPAGLWRDPNPLSQVPPGALAVASNVWIRRPGIIEPRPGFPAEAVSAAGSESETVVHLCEYDDDVFVFTVDASNNGHVYTRNAENEITRAGVFGTAAWSFSPGRVRTAIAEGNLYIACDQGVYRVTSAAATTAVRAGIPRPPPSKVTKNTLAVNEPFVADTATAYRLAETVKAGRLTVTSAPSSRIVERAPEGIGAFAQDHTFARAPANTTEVYRSPTASGRASAPTDELTMVVTAAAAASSVTDDAATTGLRGGPLYTNATERGAKLENGMPPFCRDIATFGDMLFFAAAETAPSLKFEVLAYGPDWRGGNQSYVDRLSYLVCTGGGVTVTSGSPTITGLSPTQTALLRAGMRVCDTAGTPDGNVADAQFSAGTYIQSVGATSITLNQNAIGNGTDFVAMDWVEIEVVDSAFGTTTRRVFIGQSSTGNYTVQAAEFINTGGANMGGPQLMAHAFSKLFDGAAAPLLTVSARGDGVLTPWQFTIEAFAYDVESVTVRVSNPGATPERIDRTTGKTGTRGGAPNRLAFAKPEEPEHVPPGFALAVGEAESAIFRIIPTRDALYVFKEDGVFRVVGDAPETLRVDEYDRTLRLVHPDAACEWDGAAVAWTTRGVMLLSDGGQQNLSIPIQSDVDAMAGAVSASSFGQFLAAWYGREALILRSTESTDAYVFSMRSRTWSTWTFYYGVTAASGAGERLRLGSARFANAAATYVLEDDAETHDAADLYTDVHSVPSATSVRIVASTTQWIPKIGDTLTKGAYTGTVTSDPVAEDVSGTPVYTFSVADTTGLTTGAGTGTTSAVSASIEITERASGAPAMRKTYRWLTLLLNQPTEVEAVSVSHSSDRVTTSASEAVDAADFRGTKRVRIPRNFRKCQRITSALDVRTATPDWELLGLVYTFEPKTGRVDAA